MFQATQKLKVWFYYLCCLTLTYIRKSVALRRTLTNLLPFRWNETQKAELKHKSFLSFLENEPRNNNTVINSYGFFCRFVCSYFLDDGLCSSLDICSFSVALILTCISTQQRFKYSVIYFTFDQLNHISPVWNITFLHTVPVLCIYGSTILPSIYLHNHLEEN